jgi:hypothetical protein
MPLQLFWCLLYGCQLWPVSDILIDCRVRVHAIFALVTAYSATLIASTWAHRRRCPDIWSFSVYNVPWCIECTTRAPSQLEEFRFTQKPPERDRKTTLWSASETSNASHHEARDLPMPVAAHSSVGTRGVYPQFPVGYVPPFHPLPLTEARYGLEKLRPRPF